ncbi:hypothetical protein BJV82DRAFT_601184 [Fennellomyces sp. T-0311]|nr:hypothetical protein BJV82DRAFT_601184 [Fennellomyces sp. T-0311]
MKMYTVRPHTVTLFNICVIGFTLISYMARKFHNRFYVMLGIGRLSVSQSISTFHSTITQEPSNTAVCHTVFWCNYYCFAPSHKFSKRESYEPIQNC